MLSPHNPLFTGYGLGTSNDFCFFVCVFFFFCVCVCVLFLRCCSVFVSFVLVLSLDRDCCGTCTGSACQSVFCALILAGLFALIQCFLCYMQWNV